MEKGTRVSFSWETAPGLVSHGFGVVIGDVEPGGEILVAAEPTENGAPLQVLYCKLSQLQAIEG